MGKDILVTTTYLTQECMWLSWLAGWPYIVILVFPGTAAGGAQNHRTTWYMGLCKFEVSSQIGMPPLAFGPMDFALVKRLSSFSFFFPFKKLGRNISYDSRSRADIRYSLPTRR